VREPHLRGAEALRKDYVAKATAELTDADALGAAEAGLWEGSVVGPRIAFVADRAHRASAPVTVLEPAVAEAVGKAAEALGAGDSVFAIAARGAAEGDPAALAARLRLALEAVDPIAVISLDTPAADVLAAAFGLPALRPGAPVRAAGRTVGSVGEFAASLDDPDAKTAAWIAMKTIAAAAGLEAKARSKATQDAASAAEVSGPKTGKGA